MVIQDQAAAPSLILIELLTRLLDLALNIRQRTVATRSEGLRPTELLDLEEDPLPLHVHVVIRFLPRRLCSPGGCESLIRHVLRKHTL
jgi:hypothetical protein